MISKATLKQIDPIVRKVSNGALYTSYTLSQKEFVGTVDIDTSNVFNAPENMNPPYVMESDFYHRLESIGYEKPPTFLGISLEAAKTHPETNRVHDVSLRKVDSENHRKQIHLHYWLEPTSDGYEGLVATHREYRPDFCRLEGETLADMKERLSIHFSPDWSTTEYQRGVTDTALEGAIE